MIERGKGQEKGDRETSNVCFVRMGEKTCKNMQSKTTNVTLLLKINK